MCTLRPWWGSWCRTPASGVRGPAPRRAPPGPPPAPSVFTNWTHPLPYTHRVGNADSVPLHYVVAEWVGRSGGEGPTLPADGERKRVAGGPPARGRQIHP